MTLVELLKDKTDRLFALRAELRALEREFTALGVPLPTRKPRVRRPRATLAHKAVS